MRHDPWEVPESTCYTAAEWEAAQAVEDPSSTQAAAAAAAGAGSSRPGTPALSSGAGPDTSRASTPVLGDPTAGAAAAGGGDAPAAAGAAAGAGAEGDQQRQGAAAAGTGAAAVAAGPPGQQQQQQLSVKGSRSTTWRSKLRVCQSLEPRRITFGKSGIHGWGIFARRPIPADTMVTEFRGQLIRGILADVREAEYRKQVGARGVGGARGLWEGGYRCGSGLYVRQLLLTWGHNIVLVTPGLCLGWSGVTRRCLWCHPL